MPRWRFLTDIKPEKIIPVLRVDCAPVDTLVTLLSVFISQLAMYNSDTPEHTREVAVIKCLVYLNDNISSSPPFHSIFHSFFLCIISFLLHFCDCFSQKVHVYSRLERWKLKYFFPFQRSIRKEGK